MNISKFFKLSLALCLAFATSSTAIAQNKSKSSDNTKSQKSSKSDGNNQYSLESKRIMGIKLFTPNPSSALDYNNRAVELGTKGFYPEAIAHHRQATKLDPDNKTFKVNLSSINLKYGSKLIKEGKTKAAIERLKEAVKVDSNNKPAQKLLDKLMAT